jgi:hypothetical protein
VEPIVGSAMSLTRLERRLLKEAEAISAMAQVNFADAEDWETGTERQTLLKISIHNMVVAAVVQQYTLLDEILANAICEYYFKRPGEERFIFWRRKKFKTFVHFILDEMYLLKKMEVIHAIKPIPKDTRETIRKCNAIRNSLAHSFFPENRKEHMKTKKVLYAGKNIRSPEGLERFLGDCHDAWVVLAKRIGFWKDDFDEPEEELS